MTKDKIKSAVRTVIGFPLVVIDFVGYFFALAWVGFMLMTLKFAQWLAKKIPLSDGCPYAKSKAELIGNLKKSAKTVFVDIFDAV